MAVFLINWLQEWYNFNGWENVPDCCQLYIHQNMSPVKKNKEKINVLF